MTFRPTALPFAALLILLATVCRGAVDHGEVLLDQLSCTSCHQASAQSQDRFLTRPAALLGPQGIRFTPQWLSAFLAAPGPAMPDMLHGISPSDKARAIQDLTQYLVSREQPAAPPFESQPSLIDKGRELFNTVGCVACHAPTDLPSRLAADAQARAQLTSLQASSVPLPDASMTSVPQLAAFLRDPVRFHPSGRMPSLKLSSSEATAIAAYLLRAQMPAAPESLPGIRYEYFEGHFRNLPNFDRLAVAASGLTPAFTLSLRHRNDHIAFRYRASLQIPVQGRYRFFTNSDDGSQLLIDGTSVVDNDGVHTMQEQSGQVTLAPGLHAITVLYFNVVADFGLQVSWQGPGIPKQEIPPSSLSHFGSLMAPAGRQPFTLDPAAAARGRALYAQFNCAACHEPGASGHPGINATPLAQLTLSGSDCLSPTPAAGLPLFTLSQEDRAAIRATLGHDLSRPLDPHAAIERTMAVLNCYACHERDQQGGPEGLRREYFSSLPPELDLGDEGRIPPRLTGVGAKLQQSWMAGVLLSGSSVRPYVATRMPQFGAANVGFMPAAFLAADSAGIVNPNLEGDIADRKAGRNLAGITGLACIACHNFEGHPSLGVPAIDLTVMTERLQTGWFHRYLIDPQSLRPGTRMPSFWPGGKAANRAILGGDTDLQIAALWTFLSQGQSADFPDGLIHGSMELIPDKQAVMYRNFIRGVDPRAISVGYPEKASLTFDADDMRIALIWQGPFLDVAPQRTGRGMGSFLTPLGHDLIPFPHGPPFAQLSSAADPWPTLKGKPAGYQFRGYHLDSLLRPAFSYDDNGIHITDYPVAIPGKEDSTLRRTLTLDASAPPSNLYFRAAAGKKISQTPDGAYLIDGRLTLKFTDLAPAVRPFQGGSEVPTPLSTPPGAIIRQSGGEMELLVPIRFTGPEAALQEDYTW